MAREAGIPLLLASSIKPGLDRTWTESEEKEATIEDLANQMESLQQWLKSRLTAELKQPPLKKHVDVLEQIVEQDLDDGLMLACAITPANAPEKGAVADLNNDLEAQSEENDALYIDRGYISSSLVTVIFGRGGEDSGRHRRASRARSGGA